ncbi:hypothetical protein MPLDJ20_20019 [Mesorhizobium plurifarium]|uniref:Uncharacterized protein n=2 Tax=Mesorhizobium TaxID=68287 RepID=A0A090ETR7_MESPL|nr:hypothetical protein MPLDJ20_20019 [Mesorhizobium plurifarium]
MRVESLRRHSTQRMLNRGIYVTGVSFPVVPKARRASEVQMILNHKQAIGWVIDNIATVEIAPEK